MNKRILVAALCVTGLVSSQLLAQQENGHKKTIVTHTGTVRTFEKADPAFVVIKTDKGEINAELAPMSFIEENKIMLAPDDAITLKGYEMTKDGKKTFIVTELTTKDSRVVRFRGADFNPVWTTKVTTTEAPMGKIITHKAKVKSFERGDPSFVVITTDKGEFNAELAPMTFLDENKLMFAPNDEIIVKGYETTRDGKTVFVVTEVTTKDKAVVRLRTERGPVWVTKVTTEKIDIRDVTGAVTIVEDIDTPDGRLVTIKADGGERVIALAPGTYLEKNKYVLKPGETIAVKGYEVDRSGKRIFLATEVKKGDALWKFRRADGTVLWE
jgi:hypothetical protein